MVASTAQGAKRVSCSNLTMLSDAKVHQQAKVDTVNTSAGMSSMAFFFDFQQGHTDMRGRRF